MSAIEHALTTLDPISLQATNQLAELQTRVDRKYLVDEATLVQLITAVAPSVRVLQIDGRQSSLYRSTYFDTESLELFRAAVQGRRHRYKIRSRTYGETGPCFLEVKAKGRRGHNVKARIPYRRTDHAAITSEGDDFVEQATGAQGLAAALRPTLCTEYVRSTLIDPGTRTRLTLDRGLQCTDLAVDDCNEAMLDAIVIETKTTGPPSAADRWLWEHHRRPTSISKYCTGLAATRPELPANKWHTLIARHWRTPSTPSLGIT
ncbi:MAG: polyphosphate polymerase domain-containing protein [Acidimicrobiales bacterium]